MFFRGALMSKRTAWLLSVLAFLLFSVALYRPYSIGDLLAGDRPTVIKNENLDFPKLELGDTHIVVTMGYLDVIKDGAPNVTG